jgi:hypothetical protein
MNARSSKAQPVFSPWIVDGPTPTKGPHHNVAPARTLQVPLLGERGQSERNRSRAELAQRGRLILDVATADLDAAQRTLGPSHATTWHFRTALDEARRSWERLRLELGTAFLETALRQPPLVVLGLQARRDRDIGVELMLIGGQTYCTQAVGGTSLAPIQWRLTRLNPPLDHGPYYVCRLADGSTQCDCADWTYRIAELAPGGTTHCKHLEALVALGRI